MVESFGLQAQNKRGSTLLVALTARAVVLPLYTPFLGAFTKLLTETVSYVVSVSPSVRPHRTTGRIGLKFDI